MTGGQLLEGTEGADRTKIWLHVLCKILLCPWLRHIHRTFLALQLRSSFEELRSRARKPAEGAEKGLGTQSHSPRSKSNLTFGNHSH